MVLLSYYSLAWYFKRVIGLLKIATIIKTTTLHRSLTFTPQPLAKSNCIYRIKYRRPKHR